MRILIADDQPDVRSALTLLLEQEPEYTVVGYAVEADALPAAAQATLTEVVLLDWELPGLSIGRFADLRKCLPGVCWVAMSGRVEAGKQSLAAGADAFVSKSDPPEALLQVLRRLAQSP